MGGWCSPNNVRVVNVGECAPCCSSLRGEVLCLGGYPRAWGKSECRRGRSLYLIRAGGFMPAATYAKGFSPPTPYVTAIRARGSVSGSRRTTEALMAEYILTRELSPGEFPSVSSVCVCVCRRASVGKNGARDLTCGYYFELTYIWRRTACHVTILLTATVPFLCHVRAQAD